MLIADIMYPDHGHGWIQCYQVGQLVIFHFTPCCSCDDSQAGVGSNLCHRTVIIITSLDMSNINHILNGIVTRRSDLI